MADYLTEAFIRLKRKLKYNSGRILSDFSEAEDILQDCFVRLWRRKYPLQSEKEAEALLTRAVRNASINERRKKKRIVQLDCDIADESLNIEERERAYNEMHLKINSELTNIQRFILEEKEYGGRTLEDIAKELGVESAAVRMQLSRARKTLRNAIKDER